MSGLTREEEDFVQWMDEVELEEVNLLEVAPAPDGPGKQPETPAERERRSGEREKLEAPKHRGVGWDENE